MRVGTLKRDLAQGADEIRETHISWVFLCGDSVYKVKKPVSLGFLDFSTLEKRRQACEAEVELNARLAPEVYRGVVPVIVVDGEHRFGEQASAGEGQVVDWAVHMRRLRDEDRADCRLEKDALEVTHVDRMAETIARFHADCRADEETGRYGEPASIAGNVRENFDQTHDAIRRLLREEEADAIETYQLQFLEKHAGLFLERVRAGRVRDGHGDLRLEHFYFEGDDPAQAAVRVLDCIEFNERFRYADVASDLSFLSMDLAWHGRVDLAERLLATYARETSDFDLYRLVDFYESYRGYVRGKVATMLAGDEDAPSDARERAEREARRYFLLALAMERRPLLEPTLVAVGGVIATGKSTLADHLGAALGAPAINTDRIRKHMLGARPTDRLYEGSWSGAYDPEFTERVYDEVRRCARVVVESGRPVILDASFRSAAMREDAKALAASLGVPFRFLECRADPDVCRARLKVRDQQTTVSDGRLEIFDDFLAKWEPVTELSPDEHVVVDTERPMRELLEQLRRHVPMWPEGLTE